MAKLFVEWYGVNVDSSLAGSRRINRLKATSQDFVDGEAT